MTTQTTNEKNNSGLKAGLKTILVVAGTLLIPFYAVYFNIGSVEKLEDLKSAKPVVKTVKKKIDKTTTHLAENKPKNNQKIFTQIQIEKHFVNGRRATAEKIFAIKVFP